MKFQTLFAYLFSFSGVLLSLTTSAQNQLSGATSTTEWTRSYESAIAAARTEGKDLLLVFTSSADIVICERLNRDVLEKSEFMDPVSERFELVRLEFPKADPNQPVAERSQNELLKQAYRITGFPTMLLTDTEGRPYGVKGYQPMAAEEYAKILMILNEVKSRRDEKFKAAESAVGLEKAKLLAEGIPVLPGTLMGRYYRAQMQLAIDNDPENLSGSTKNYKKVLADLDYSQEMNQLGRDVQWGKMIDLTDQYIADQKLKGLEKQVALMNKFNVQRQQQNMPGSVETLIEVANIDKESGPGRQAVKVLETLRTQNLQEKLLK